MTRLAHKTGIGRQRQSGKHPIARFWDQQEGIRTESQERPHCASFIQTPLSASSLPNRIQLLVLVYQAVHHLGPAYLTPLVTAYAPTRSLGSAANSSLTILRYSFERYGWRSLLWRPNHCGYRLKYWFAKTARHFSEIDFYVHFNNCSDIIYLFIIFTLEFYPASSLSTSSVIELIFLMF